MKKFLSILVVVALMAGFLVPSAHAAEGFQIVVSSVNSATAGETVTLTVSLVNNPGVTNGKITVEYDANFFEPVASGAITPGALATNAGATVMSNGYIMNFVAPMGIEGDGVLFNVTLKVKDGATGSGTVKANVSYLKNNGTAVTVAAADGTVAMAPAAHVHETTKVPAKAADCTNPGNTEYYTCACGAWFKDAAATQEITDKNSVVIAAGHSLTDVAEVKATCTAEGTKAHQKCGACGKLFVNGTEVTAAQLVTDKAAHEMGEWTQTKAPTETEKGEESRKCKNCDHTDKRDVDALGHTCAPVDVAEVPATCTTNGTKAHKKCACGKLYIDGKEVTAADLVIPAAGHKAGDPNLEWKDGVCTSVLKCEVCGTVLGEVKLEVKEELTDKDVPAGLKDTEFNTVEKIEEEMKTQLETVGASSNVQVDAENTYLVDVVLMYTDKDGNTQVADKEHFPENGKLTVTIAVPAGTNPTTHKYHVVHMFTSDAFGKKAGDVEVFTNLQAKSDGNGGYYLSFEVTGLSPIMICTEEIKEAHTCAPVDVAEVKATCDVNGTKAHKKCACGKLYVDGKEVTAADLVIPAKHGNLVHMDAVAPGCHYEGVVEHWICYTCERVWTDEALTQLTNIKNVIAPATGGKIVHVEAKESTCFENGNIEYWYCEECEQVWQNEALTQLTNFKNVILGALNHCNLVHMEAVAPGCHYEGLTEHWYCPDCESVWSDEALTQITNHKNVIIPATGGDVVHFEAIEPGCHYDGNIEYWVCYECEQVWQDEALTQLTNIKNVILPAKGGEVVHVEAKAPTCLENGNIEYWYCEECEQVWQDEARTQLTNFKNVILGALGHNYVNGTCTNCGDVPATGDTMISVAVAAALISAMSIVALPVIKKRF